MCEVLEVSRSGFYAWRKRSESERSQRQRELVAEMQQIHSDRDRKSYGSPRMRRELAARGHAVSENTVAKLMRDRGLVPEIPGDDGFPSFTSDGGKRTESRVSAGGSESGVVG